MLTFAKGLKRNSPFDIITAGKVNSDRHEMQENLEFSNSNRVIPLDMYPKLPQINFEN